MRGCEADFLLKMNETEGSHRVRLESQRQMSGPATPINPSFLHFVGRTEVIFRSDDFSRNFLDITNERHIIELKFLQYWRNFNVSSLRMVNESVISKHDFQENLYILWHLWMFIPMLSHVSKPNNDQILSSASL
jgi:hypothetical protein